MRQLKDFYNEMRRCLAKAPLFVLYLDGFGYYEYARKKGVIPCMEEHFLIEPVCSVKPPVTNPAMATILTGRLPKQHLITDRRGHVPAVPTIFGEWKEQAVCLEGDSVIIRTEILPRLHTARQGNSPLYGKLKRIPVLSSPTSMGLTMLLIVSGRMERLPWMKSDAKMR